MLRSISAQPRGRRLKDKLDVPEVVAVMEQMTAFTSRLVVLVLLMVISIFSIVLLLLHAVGAVTLPQPAVVTMSTVFGASFVGSIARAALGQR